ncbi:MAG TPA: hypothetical protein VN397_01850 [Candidatus Methylomirabilis sp.]|nr:hypothetical protein [Candidatus Methylomirabilis sp.]
MKFDLQPLNDVCKLGLDPAAAKEGKRTDVAFYDWVAGRDPSGALSKFIVWLLDELKEEKSQATIREVLNDWQSACSPEEFQSRLKVLGRLMPNAHPFHGVKDAYLSNGK